ncbi:bifunctional (p)ppGpp synthetase/guanosine-3',5'-bis(diphosphate) 3'-pyrophosphohydrolase [Candidatus Uhrbacteria bacterium]|nr:bifunctional (p)ppGpp synthetase/guanosine-3',5'-bis(diphosphate) 3'-pyrophosphohydrolase [Candidatus Uhrbacteria bacterium]
MSEILRTYPELAALIEKRYKQPDLDLVARAYQLAAKAHGDEKRSSGTPYIIHPLAVAYKLADMGIHLNVVAAGLLHDVVEDTGVTLEDVRREFGDDIAMLVDSVTKLKHVRYQGVERYVENMRKMFLAMASDVRVVFIKFADRLHNMQTLYAMPKHTQQRTAAETMEIYAPIAGRLGMGEFKGEMEDLSFAYLHPKEYERMQRIMQTRVREKGVYVSRIIDHTEKLLEGSGVVDAQVHGRIKRLWSLYKKLNKYHDEISKVYDIIAVRVIVKDVEECYIVLGIIHQKWRPVPGRIKDYISQPKPNGYQSLHTTVFASDGEIVEFQIRTTEMHDQAEYGIASHWSYKEDEKSPKRLKWMQELASLQKALDNKKEFLDQLEHMKIDVFRDRIFVFTPGGDVIDLPEGATPVDFAYAIHTDIGNACTAVKINTVVKNLDTPLRSSDMVEIITDKNRKSPNADWLKFVKTRHAAKKIQEATKIGVKRWFVNVLRRGKRTSEKQPPAHQTP